MVWIWVAGWVLLVLFAAVVLGVLGRTAWRKTKTLFREFEAASERLSVVTERLQDAVEEREQAELAVFSSPLELRAERWRAERGRRSGGRHASPTRRAVRRERTTT